MKKFRAAPGAAKPRRWLSTAVVAAALVAGVGVGVMLPDSTTQLDAAHKQVESLTTRTELLSAELTGARTDNTSLSDLFEEAEAEVRALGKQLDAARKRGDARDSKLDQREKALDQQEKDLAQREKTVEQRQGTFDQQAKDLDQREKALDQRQEALDQRRRPRPARDRPGQAGSSGRVVRDPRRASLRTSCGSGESTERGLLADRRR